MFDAAERLVDCPLTGRERPEVAPPPTRFLVLAAYPHVILYQPRAGDVPVILRILHGAMDLPAALRDG